MWRDVISCAMQRYDTYAYYQGKDMRMNEGRKEGGEEVGLKFEEKKMIRFRG